MIANRVHAVIAAGLENPQLLKHWQREPELLRRHGVDPDALDLTLLWKFVGLTTKIRHNGLRADFPLTFRLLNVAGLEVEVFASYASFRASEGGPYANTTEARAQDLLAFLEHWLDFDKREHLLLWDLMRFELALTRLSKMATAARGLQTARSLAQPIQRVTNVPQVCGDIILHEMQSDPRVVGAALHEKSPQLDEVPLGAFLFCYWRRDAATEIHILQLDILGFYLLSFTDGSRSIADLSRLIAGSRRPAKGFLQALGELIAIGILRFDPILEQIP
jgi:hypothetical protein